MRSIMTDARRPLIAGNWKMNGLKASLNELAAIGQGADAISRKADLLVCPPATLLFLAMAHAERGDTQAAAAARRLRTEFPDFSVEGFMIGYPVKNPPAVAAIHRAAGRAGLA